MVAYRGVLTRARGNGAEITKERRCESYRKPWDPISKISCATEALHGLKPLCFNATSNRCDLTIERYRTGRRTFTPRPQFEDQTLVTIQWTGRIRENVTTFRSMSSPNATSIFPIEVALQENTPCRMWSLPSSP
jgi:hypothetical protein